MTKRKEIYLHFTGRGDNCPRLLEGPQSAQHTRAGPPFLWGEDRGDIASLLHGPTSLPTARHSSAPPVCPWGPTLFPLQVPGLLRALHDWMAGLYLPGAEIQSSVGRLAYSPMGKFLPQRPFRVEELGSWKNARDCWQESASVWSEKEGIPGWTVLATPCLIYIIHSLGL